MIDAYLDEDDEWSGEDESPFSGMGQFVKHRFAGEIVSFTLTYIVHSRYLVFPFLQIT